MKILKELNFGTLCFLYLFGLSLFTFQYIYTYTPVSNAQLSILATLIGGTTDGVTDVCCNGVVLEFSSQNTLNTSILDGEALFVPVVSTSYSSGNEYSSDYATLGTIMPGLCFDVEDECYSVSSMPIIKTLGTSGKTVQ